MKIAIFHQALDNIGGAEIVTLTLARKLNADIYTTNINHKNIIACGFSDIVSRIYSIGTLPRRAPFRQQLALWKMRMLNLSGRYNQFIISGDWAISAAVKNHPNIWYIHGPLNELWEFKKHISNEVISWWMRPLYYLWVSINQKLILSYARHVDQWVCNSLNVKKRVLNIFGTSATVVYPPIEVSEYSYKNSKGYWLSVNRLVGHKRIEIQLEAFRQMPDQKLIIVGSYEKGARQFETYKKKLEAIKPANVTFQYWVSDEELKKLYAECIGFITTAEREDFGMTAVEAMASGKPVIAPDDGGYRESVISGKTGILIHDINAEKLAKAVASINSELQKNPLHYRDACQKRAQAFDTSRFIAEIRQCII